MKTKLAPLMAVITCMAASSASAALIAHYSFDVDLTDSSGNNNHGTQLFGTTTETSGVTSTDSVLGGGSYRQNIGSDRIDIPDQAFAANASWSFAAWVKKDATNDQGMIAGSYSGNTNYLWLNSTNLVRVNTSTGTRYDTDPASNLAADIWDHWAFTKDGTSTELKVYRNGTLENTFATTAGGIDFNVIAHGYGTSQFGLIGYLDEVYIYSNVLSQSEVTSLATIIPEPSSAALLGLAGLGLLARRRR